MPEDNPRKRRSVAPLIIGLIALILLAGGGYYAWQNFMPAPEEEPTPTPEAQQPVQPALQQYASTTMKVSMSYPAEFTLQEPYAYTRVSETKPISGAKIMLPTSMTVGTNLASDSGISIEQLPRALKCSGDIFLKANVRARDITEGARTYSVASSTETVGEDVFDEVVYAVPGSSPCVAVRYFLHSSTIGNMATGTRPYDRATVITIFDAIRGTLSVQ